jgi:hypothetical protein
MLELLRVFTLYRCIGVSSGEVGVMYVFVLIIVSNMGLCISANVSYQYYILKGRDPRLTRYKDFIYMI